MKKIFCLSDAAIQVLKTNGVKGKIMYVLEINDTRTIDKHIKNNFPNNPLLNFNVREIIKEVAPDLNDKDIFRKLTKKDIERLNCRRREQQALNAKYNNLKRQSV